MLKSKSCLQKASNTMKVNYENSSLDHWSNRKDVWPLCRTPPWPICRSRPIRRVSDTLNSHVSISSARSLPGSPLGVQRPKWMLRKLRTGILCWVGWLCWILGGCVSSTKRYMVRKRSSGRKFTTLKTTSLATIWTQLTSKQQKMTSLSVSINSDLTLQGTF